MISPLRRIVFSRPILFLGLLCGLISFGFLPSRLRGETRGIVAWDIGVGVFLILSAVLFFTAPPARMAANAEAEQEGEWTIFSLVMAGTAVSFIAIVSEFSAMKTLHPAARSLHVALVAYTLFASWLMAHTTFAFRYAHEYYQRSGNDTDFDRGLEFPGEKQPDYLDFLYFALVLGMTFQVSDVQITSRKLRRLATMHGLLGFLYNTVILALTVNLAAGLLS